MMKAGPRAAPERNFGVQLLLALWHLFSTLRFPQVDLWGVFVRLTGYSGAGKGANI